MLHITVGLLSIGLGVSALVKNNRRLLMLQIATFVGTVGTGIGLVVISPSTLAHFCVTGVIFSVISVTMMLVSRRRLAYT